jgi:hypothetical protein
MMSTMSELEIFHLPQEFDTYPLNSAEFGMNYYPHCFDVGRIAMAGFVDRQTEFGYGDPLLLVNGQISWEDTQNKATAYYGISNPNNEGYRLTGGQWVRYAERLDTGEEELISWFDDESRAILFDTPIPYEQSAYEALIQASRTRYALDTATE